MSANQALVDIITSYYEKKQVEKENVMFALNFMRAAVDKPDVFQQVEMMMQSGPLGEQDARELKRSLFMKVMNVYDSNTDSRYIFDVIAMTCDFMTNHVN